MVATLVAFVVGYLIIGWFLKYVSNKSYSIFVWYRIALGLALYILLGTGVLERLGDDFDRAGYFVNIERSNCR